MAHRDSLARARVATLVASVSLALLSPVALAAPASAAGPEDGVADLRKDIDRLLDDPALKGARSGVLVRSLSNGDTLYEHHPDRALTPASNTKLLTSAAAMEVLGPDYRFSTTVSAGEDPGDGVVDGDLYLVGTGDPSLTTNAFDDLAAEVADSGVERVRGDLVADDTWFDAQRLAPDWDPADEPYYYAAQISALTTAANSDLDTGVVNVTGTPGDAKGDPVEVRLDPMTPNLNLTNDAATGSENAEPDFDVQRPSGTNDFAATGTLPANGEPFTGLRTVHEPTDHAAHLFAAALEDHGVRVDGGVERGTEQDGATPVADRESMPLSELLTPFMKLSNNGHAEILVKAMGRETSGEGSWDAGLAEVEPALKRIGAHPQRVEMNDGSGLSATNRLNAVSVVDLFGAVRDEPWGKVWEDSLPVAGARDRMVGGTLTNRMRDTPAEGNVHAKTGTLTGASALSGYVTGADGEQLAFSIINNDYEGPAPRDIQDAIAVRLAEFSRDRPTTGEPSTRAQQAPAPTAPDANLECTWAGTC